jgi:tRNA (adenine57-N1/adenine58-N1)-methyltransferase
MKPAQENDPVLLIGPRNKRFIVYLKAGDQLHTHMGIIAHDAIIGKPLGREILSHLKKPFLVLEPSADDLIVQLPRKGQIVYPKEAGFALLRMNIHSGKRVIEAGTGCGGFTLAISRSVAPEGRVYSYEIRPDMQAVAKKNLEKLGLDSWVEFKIRDIAEGFDETDVDAVFLDLRTPWDFLAQVQDALKPGGFFGSLLPTTNQVSRLVQSLEHNNFADTEVLEILQRNYKPVPDRLRPTDVMVGHTGYLVFSRKISRNNIGVSTADYQEEALS